MIKKLLALFIVASILPLGIKADWVSLDNYKGSNTPPQVSILSDDQDGTTLKIELSGFDLNDFVADGKSYQSLDLLNEIFTNEPGNPVLPYIAKTLAVPDQAVVSVEVVEMGEVQTFGNIYLPPARESWIEGSVETPFTENEAVYKGANVYPQDYARVDPPAIFRDFRIARVSVFPFHYYPSEQKLEVVSSITVRVNYESGDAINPKTKEKSPIPPSFGKLYRSLIFNYQEVLDNLYAGKETGHELMLCIMPDIFIESFEIYAEWKRQSGIDVHVTAFSDINATATNPATIKTHITNAYNNWDTPPTYVLIVGDYGIFPHKIVAYDYSFPNEDYFVEIEGDDYFPEMMIGRFTNQGDYRMQVMINKFMLYEKEPYIEEDEWFKKGICCSNNAYPSQVDTKRFAAKKMMEDGEFTSVDTLMSDGSGWWGGDCSMDLQDVVACLEDGRSFLNYRGEGWYSGWSANCYQFSTYEVSALNNGEKFTFVTSIGCGVAGFQSYDGNCFGEEWIQLGSLTDPRGAIGFVGPVSNTHTTYNNKIDKGIYTGMFEEDMDTPGQALLRGKLYMYNVFGNEYWVEYHYRVYSVLGDPSIHVWKEVPQEIEVDHVASVNVGSNSMEFTVTYASSGDPVVNAELCLTGENLFVTGISNASGEVYLEAYPDLAENLVVTVRGGDVIPYQGEIEVFQGPEYVEPYGDPVILDLNGNENGYINPGEYVDISFTLRNWGAETANSVTAMLISPNNDLVEVLTEYPVDYGDLGSGESLTGTPILLAVSTSCTVGQVIPMQLEVNTNSNTWTYDYPLLVTGCMLECNNFVVYDEYSMPMNFRMDPGETVKLVLSVKNYGDDVAPNVIGVLSSNDPYIEVTDPTGSFGTVNMGGAGINDLNYFMVSVDESCPSGYMAEYSLELQTQEGGYEYLITTTVEIPVNIPIETDYSGPDEYGYYAYSNDDSFFDKAPEYEWIEMDGVGTQLNVPNQTNYTSTVNLPFTFKYYGIDYDLMRISTDGFLAFGNGSQTAPYNTSLPNVDDVNSMVAVFWDDLVDEELEGWEIYTYHDVDNHRYIIEWDSLAHNFTSGEPDRETFQAILLDPEFYPTFTGDGEIIMLYKDISAYDSMTVGIENYDQDIALQYVFDNQYAATATPIYNEYAVKFTTEPPFLSITVSDDEQELPGYQKGGLLGQNIPNPFHSNTRIYYSVPQTGNVSLNIYNIRGDLVRSLQNGKKSAGQYAIDWNGQDETGNAVSPGIYFYQLRTNGKMETKKMFRLK